MSEAYQGVVKVMVTIVDRGKGCKVVDLYKNSRLHFNYICLGQGTANSEMLDYFGLGETQKDFVISMVPEERVSGLIGMITGKMQLRSPGHGIVFTVPLSGVSRAVSDTLRQEIEWAGEEKRMENAMRYDLVVAIVNHGHVDEVMTAAKSAGAKGGTVLHARRAGFEEAESVAGFTIQPEKEIVAILIPHGEKLAVMKAVNQAAGLATESRGILFSLPVDEIAGLNGIVPGEDR